MWLPTHVLATGMQGKAVYRVGEEMIHKSAVTKFCAEAYMPEIDRSACIHPLAAVIGHVKVDKRVMVALFASIRGDEGRPIIVGDESNVQDGVVMNCWML